MGKLIHVHGKFTLESNFQNFIESCFTSVLNCKILFSPIHMISAITLEITLKLTNFSLKITRNWENCHLQISRFTHMMKSKITFMLNSRKFCLQPFISRHSCFLSNLYISDFWLCSIITRKDRISSFVVSSA